MIGSVCELGVGTVIEQTLRCEIGAILSLKEVIC